MSCPVPVRERRREAGCCPRCGREPEQGIRCNDCRYAATVTNGEAQRRQRIARGVPARRCGRCGGERHNARTCPQKESRAT